MREKRLEAYALYESLPMPHTTEDDLWRRTVDMRTQDYWRRTRRHLRGFALEKYYPNIPTNGKPPAENIDDNDEKTAGTLVQVDGQLQHTSDTEILKKHGVYFCTPPHCLAGTTGTSPHLLHEQSRNVRNNVKEWKYCPTQQI